MSGPHQPSPPRFSRRALLGWIASICGATVLITFIAAVEGFFSNIPRLISWNSKRAGRIPGHDRAKLARIRRKAQTVFAFSNPNLVLVVHRSRENRIRSSVVHWPHPWLFGRQLPLKQNHRTLQNDQWKKIVQPHCGKGVPWGNSSTTHFYAAREAVIREHLALAELSFGSSNNVQGLDKALAVLAPLFDEDRSRCNWRIYYLYSRLVCWKEPDAELARAAILRTAWSRADTEAKPIQLAFLSSIDEFRKWHTKSRTDRFLQRLKKRTQFAQSLRGGQSSSGQDTATAERVRSNRPRPLATRKQTRTRVLKLRRRKERRGAHKKLALWNRVTILWKRSAPQSSQDELNRSTKGGPHKIHLRKVRHTNKPKAQCTVSKRKLQCIPIEGKSKMGRIVLQ